MKRSRAFKEGDKVFAKIKGYPSWPAVVLGKSGKKVNVQFYGTGETGTLKPDEICYYLKNKEQMIKGSKKKEFKEAIDQIEKAIAVDGTDGDNSPPDEDGPSAKRKRTNSERSSDSAPSKRESNAVNSGSDDESNVSGSVADSNDASTRNEPARTQSSTHHSQNEEELPFIPDVKIVSEMNLRNWIIYADIVKEKEEIYKAMPVAERSYFVNQVFPVLLPTGKYAGLKVHKTWPLLSYSNEYDCALYDNEAASRMLLLKESVTAGEITPETDPDSFFADFNMGEAEIKRDAEMKLINNKYKRVERLRSESTVVELDSKIKNCLGLNKADPKKAIGFLDNIMEIKVDEIMLKKHSHLVEMIRRLRKYIGNTEEWNLSQDELETFLADAQKLRAKADEVYRKFKAAIKLPDNVTNFWDGFNDLVKKFRDDCKFLTNREVFILTAEPYARQAIMDRLEQEEELQEAELQHPEEADKVGES